MNTRMTSEMDKPTMTPIPPGILRAYLDNDPSLDAAARDDVTRALATDPATVACLEALRATRAAVDRAFAPLAVPPPTAAAVDDAYRCFLARRRTAPAPLWNMENIGFAIKEYFAAMTTPIAPFGSPRVRRFALLGGVGAVALALLITFAPVGNLASAALNLFRYQPDKFAVITFHQSDFGGAGSMTGAHVGAISGMKPTGSLGTKAAGAVGTKPAGAVGPKTAGVPGAENAQALAELSKYVTVTSSLKQGQLPARPVKTAADAQAVTGRAAVAPTYLPTGTPNQPIYYVSDAQKVDATIDLKTLRPALAANGVDGVLPPTGDTATVHVDVPTAAITSYGINPALAMSNSAAAANQKGIVVIAMGTPSVDVQGLDVTALANTLASMPGVPPQLAAQLRSADLNHTLVIPVSDNQTVKNGTFINGNASTLIAQNDGSGAVALWFNRGILYIVAGTYDGNTIEKVAQSVK